MQLKISKLIVALIATCLNLDNINFVKSQDNLINNNNEIKTREEKLETCIDGFVVHRNKIIRTQDSTDMGAKYLNEFDVDTKIECMKLCCLTEHCDVFIFEEKKPSSCYLFHCGPPHDFKCKFTSHVNYSSAVLTNYNLQNAAALEEQIHITQQEHELKSLRKSERNHNNNYFQTDETNLKITSAPSIPSPTTVTQTPIKSAPACHRNQFECRSNGDCIAIYNVCDGIPQCPDGSDEAAELTCPVEKSTSAPTLHTITSTTPPPVPQSILSKPFLPSMPDILRYQQMMQQRNPYQFPYPVHNNNNNNNNQELEQNYGKIWPQNTHHFSPQENGYLNYPSPEEIANFGQFPINYNQPPNYQWNYPQIYENKNINGLEALPPPNFPIGYDQDQPHIYKHKPMIHPNEADSSSNVLKPYGPSQKQGYPPFYPPNNHHLEPWQEGKPIQTSLQTPIYHQNDQKNDAIATTTEAHENSKTIENKSKFEDKESKNNKSEKSLKTGVEKDKNKSNSEKHQAQNPEAQKLEQHSSSNSHLQESKNLAVSEHIRNHSIRIEDLENSSPRGAIISLVIGLSVTSVMIILISCRLKVVKRRGRGRGHDSFSHDADYLVNGMYL